MDFRFEISTKEYIRNTLHPDVVHFSKFNIAKEQCGVTEQAKTNEPITCHCSHNYVCSQYLHWYVFPCVCHGMSIQIMFTLESLITMTTLIGLFPNMCLIMLNQVAFLLRNSYHNDYIYRGFHMCVSLNTLQDHNLLRTLEHNNNIYVAYP